MTPHDERGSVLPLILVCFLIALGLVSVAAGGTALHLERLRLLTLADGAALAGAESFALDDVQVGGGAVQATLHPADVESAVRGYLAVNDTAAFDGFRLVDASAPGGRTATVTIAAIWHPPIVSSLLPVSVPIEVTSAARAEFR